MRNKNQILILFFKTVSFLIFSSSFNLTFCNFDLKIINEGDFPKAKLLPSGKYFIISDEGIYIYNQDFTINETILIFKGNDYKNTIISEYKIEGKFFISCLIKNNFLYIYEANTNKSYDIISLAIEFDYNEIYNINLIPYNYQNNILEYIIYFTTRNSEFIRFFYEIDLSKTNIQCIRKNYSVFNNNNLINNDHINCEKISQKNEEDLICFYIIDENNDSKDKIQFSFFNIKNNFSNIEIGKIYNQNGKLKDLKTIKSYNENLIFVCFHFNFNNNYNCLIYDNENKFFLNEMKTIKNCYTNELYNFDDNNETILFCYYYEFNHYKFIYNFKMYNLENNFSHFDIEETISKKFESSCFDFSLVYSPSNQFYYIISVCELDKSETQNNPISITNTLTSSKTNFSSVQKLFLFHQILYYAHFIILSIIFHQLIILKWKVWKLLILLVKL